MCLYFQLYISAEVLQPHVCPCTIFSDSRAPPWSQPVSQSLRLVTEEYLK